MALLRQWCSFVYEKIHVCSSRGALNMLAEAASAKKSRDLCGSGYYDWILARIREADYMQCLYRFVSWGWYRRLDLLFAVVPQ